MPVEFTGEFKKLKIWWFFLQNPAFEVLIAVQY